MSGKVETTCELVRRNAAEYPDTPFLNFYDEIISYQGLDERTNAFANYLLEKGVGRGDVVSYMLGNSPAVFDVLLGAQKIGAIAGPISCWWQASEVEYLVNDSRSKVLLVDPEYAPIAAEIADVTPSVEQILVNAASPVDLGRPHECLPAVLSEHASGPPPAEPPRPEDTAALMYTSGTTGNPKGVMLSHRGVLAGARIKTEGVPISAGDRGLCVLPLFHSGGLNDLALPIMYRAATIVLRRGFSASEFWDCIERYRIHAFYIVPTMWNILLRATESGTVDTSSLRFGISGAAPIPPEQLEECKERFGVPILEAYGLTESSGGIAANTLERSKYGSVGLPFEGLELRVFDPDQKPLPAGQIGEIVVRGDIVMKGYWGRTEATAETIVDGWLCTGDLGYLDDDGFLFIADRKKEMIIRGGLNVYPKEIENAIAEHPAVAAVAVIPEAHDKYGQVAKACVVRVRGEQLEEEGLRGFCDGRLAGYKVPEAFVFRASLPRNAIGKVVKKQLARELEEEAQADPVPVGHLFTGMADRFIPAKAEGVDASVSYHITGGGGGEWTVKIKNRSITVTEEILASPTVYIVASDRNYHGVATGKLDSVTAVVTGKMSVEGDVAFMAKFREMFRPIDEAENSD
jgi:acyl-CoA synthetase (AMP-forming)/AMP-acid ligase II/putative sterol carrier protein